MKRSDLLELEKTMMKEVVKRRALGGYSADAEGILTLCETLMRLLQYIIDDVVPPGPEPKPKGKSK
jgi:hypothetical protein